MSMPVNLCAFARSVSGPHCKRQQIGSISHPDRSGPVISFFTLRNPLMKEISMKLRIAIAAALLTTGFVATPTDQASAVVYCSYVGYPSGCIVRPGVVLRTRPVAGVRGVGVGAPGVGVRRGTPMNRGGPVNRAGRR
jgi:hypothetical protein